MTTLTPWVGIIGAIVGAVLTMAAQAVTTARRGRDDMAWSDKKVAEERRAAAQAKAERDARARRVAEELAAKKAEADAKRWAAARKAARR